MRSMKGIFTPRSFTQYCQVYCTSHAEFGRAIGMRIPGIDSGANLWVIINEIGRGGMSIYIPLY